jgi:hypothetical protein
MPRIERELHWQRATFLVSGAASALTGNKEGTGLLCSPERPSRLEIAVDAQTHGR